MVNIYVIYIFIFVVLGLNLYSVITQARKLTRNDLLKYFYLLLSGFLWILSNAIADISKDVNVAELSARLAIIFPIHFMSALWLLGRDFPNSLYLKEKQSNKLALLTTVAITILFLLNLYSSSNISDFEISLNGPSNYTPGYLYAVVLIYSLSVIASLIKRWVSSLNKSTETQKKKIKLIAFSVLLVFVSIGIGLTYLPAIGLASYSPIAFVSISILLYVFNRTLFVKEFLVDINKDIIQVFVLFALAYLNIVVVDYITLHTQQVNNLSRILIGIFYLTSIYLINKEIMKRSQVSIDQLRKEVLKFSSTTSDVLDKKDIQKALIQSLKKIFPRNIIEIESTYSENKSLLLSIKELFKTTKEIRTLTPEILTEIGISASNNKDILKILNLCIRKKITLILPISSGTEVSGIIKISGQDIPIERGEYNQIEALRQNVSVAMSRASLYSTVSIFNSRLEKRVEEQTKEINEKYRLLVEVQQREKDMIDIMGHELRTPISIIRLQFGLMLNKINDKAIKRVLSDYIKNINSAIEREARLINSLLGATKIDKEKLELNFQSQNLMSLVTESFQSHLTEINNKGLEGQLVSPKDSNTWIIDTDKTRFLEVLDNLIGNAVKYTQNGKITVTVSKRAKTYLISVKDTGVGIPRKAMRKLGQKFYRVESKQDESQLIRPGGTGLGLYVSKGIIEKHKGKLTVESVIGKGSNFSIEIPQKQKMNSVSKKESVNIFERLGLKKS